MTRIETLIVLEYEANKLFTVNKTQVTLGLLKIA